MYMVIDYAIYLVVLGGTLWSNDYVTKVINWMLFGREKMTTINFNCAKFYSCLMIDRI